MLSVSVARTLEYAILIRTILDKLIRSKLMADVDLISSPKYRIIPLATSLLTFGVFIYTVSPIIKTFRNIWRDLLNVGNISILSVSGTLMDYDCLMSGLNLQRRK